MSATRINAAFASFLATLFGFAFIAQTMPISALYGAGGIA